MYVLKSDSNYNQTINYSPYSSYLKNNAVATLTTSDTRWLTKYKQEITKNSMSYGCYAECCYRAVVDRWILIGIGG